MDEVTKPLTRSLDGAVYNEVVDVWMIPQEDPFRIENFQSSTRAAVEPTHYAMKIYPRTEEELRSIEQMEDVQFSYIPFGFSALTPEEAVMVEESGRATIGTSPVFNEMSPRTVTYDYTDATDGGPVGPVTMRLPILYAVWPAEKPIPGTLITAIEYEAVYKVITEPFRGHVRAYDDTIEKYVPMGGLKVTCQSGSYITTTRTDGDGIFNVEIPVGAYSDPKELLTKVIRPADVTLTFTYEDPDGRWKIVPDELLAPLFETRTAQTATGLANPNDDNWVYTHRFTFLPPHESEDMRAAEIHRAANYFYNVQEIFPSYSTPNTGTVFVAHCESGRAFFRYDHIDLYNRNIDSRNIGTVFHELAHLVQYEHNRDKWANSNNTNKMVYEAFACYVGWYLGSQYYRTIGWDGIAPWIGGHDNDISGQNQQGWTTAIAPESGWYSPLFVDLTDDYNQGGTSSLISPCDEISGVPPSKIWELITNYQHSWEQCKSDIRDAVVPQYGTNAQFEAWIETFDEWVDTYK